MYLKRLIIMLISLFLLSLAAEAADTPIKGVYIQLPDHKFKFDGKKVEIVEFLSFYCGHCYHFEKLIPAIKGNFPKKIKWKIVPIYWGHGSPKPGEAYLLAEEAGKGDEMKKALFHAFFVEKRDIGNIEVLESIALKIGLGFDFSRRLRSGEKAREVGEAIINAKNYKIEETPTLIIAGNLKTTPDMVGGLEAFRDNIITILRSLFKK
jgi:thiol:disulfide interchange protein DsbA